MPRNGISGTTKIEAHHVHRYDDFNQMKCQKVIFEADK
jgi:hypothetical protein